MKKLLSLVLVTAFLLTVIFGASIFAARIGDVNNDGSINNKDVVLLFRAVSGGEEVDKTAADFNGDGSVDNKDVVTLFRYVSSNTQSDETTEPEITTEPDTEPDTEPETETEPVGEELTVSQTGTLNIDRIHINANSLDAAPDVKDDDPIVIEVGDKLFILGWAYGASNLREIVYSIDDGDNIACPGQYRDRADVAAVFGLDASLGVNAGFGVDRNGMLELAGIDELTDGEYVLTIKAVFNDDTYLAKDFNLFVGTGIPETEPDTEPDETEPDVTTEPEETSEPGDIEYASSFTVSKVFSKNMVIQRNEIIRVWGWAPASENGKYVKAEFSGLTGYGEVIDGEWMLTLNGMLPENTTAQTMTISGDNTSVEITGVLVGDVYWIAGQSNIAYSVSNIKNEPLANELGRKVDTGTSLLIRLNRTNQTDIYNAVPTVGTNDVSKDVVNTRGWQTAKFGASAFSALGYFTAYMLYNQLDRKVPIGMIEFDGNGMALHGFLPNEVRDALNVSTKDANGVYSAAGVNQHASSYMYNHGMYAFQNFPICGFIWYQGESDCSSTNNNCYAYAERFTAFINYIRDKHDLKTNHDYPVYIVELSPSFPTNSSGQANQYIDFAAVRMNMGSIPTMLNNAHICSTEDLWKDKEYNNNLHPYNKWELAERMTKIILSYGLGIGAPEEGEGPIVESFTLSADGKTATVKFKNVGDGLVAQGGVLKGFKVATSTTNYAYWNEPATQTISGTDTVVLTYTRAIKKVAYNNSLINTFPEVVTLCNSAGVPCAAFAISD